MRTWIPSVLQFAKPYFTPNDIEKGAKWSGEISKKLSETNVGIVCLTKDNFEKPWILFEAGALSKDLDQSRVCSVLFGMDNTDLTGPLVTFQTTLFNKTDFKKLMLSVNDAGGDRALPKETFENVFNMWWPKLEERIASIVAKERDQDEIESRTDRDILDEILSHTRLNSKRAPRSSSKRRLPLGLVDQLLSSISDTIDVYEKDDDKALYGTIDRLLEISGYVISSDEELHLEFHKRYEHTKTRFNDIIPF